MSIRTILSQMKEELRKIHSVLYGNDSYYKAAEIEELLKTFATRIVEEVGKELIGEDDDENVTYRKRGKIVTHRRHIPNIAKNELRSSQRTKLQNMKEI